MSCFGFVEAGWCSAWWATSSGGSSAEKALDFATSFSDEGPAEVMEPTAVEERQLEEPGCQQAVLPQVAAMMVEISSEAVLVEVAMEEPLEDPQLRSQGLPLPRSCLQPRRRHRHQHPCRPLAGRPPVCRSSPTAWGSEALLLEVLQGWVFQLSKKSRLGLPGLLPLGCPKASAWLGLRRADCRQQPPTCVFFRSASRTASGGKAGRRFFEAAARRCSRSGGPT